MISENKDKTAVVFGGGGARGAYGLGVANYLARRAQSNKAFDFDVVVGSSCGALIAAIYYGDLLDKLTEVYLNMRKRDLMQLTPLNLILGKGIYDQSPLRRTIESMIPEDRLKPTRRKLVIVATDVKSGKLVVFNNHEHAGAMQMALYYSASAPVMCPPVVKGEMAMGDGSYRTILPIQTAIEMGATRVLAVSVSPACYPAMKRAPKSPLTLLGRWIELLCGQVERQQIRIARLQLDQSAACLPEKSRVKIILPQDVNVPDPFDFDPQNAHELYAIGQQQAANALEGHDSPWSAACCSFVE